MENQLREDERLKKLKNEAGEVMLEGIIVMCVTMFMLVWILGVGFIYYQRNVITTITNDAAVKIADTFCYPSSDLIIGYIEPDDFTNRDLYRGAPADSLLSKNQEKAKKYIEYSLKKTNFSGVYDSVDVTLDVVNDSAYRKHIEITAKATFNTPFGGALEFFGMDGTFTYTAVGRADCTDIIDYVSTVDYNASILSGDYIKSDVKNLISSITSLIYNLVDIFNHTYD